MNADLEKMSKADLKKLLRDVEKAIASFDKREKKAALEAAERAAQEHGFSLAQLTGISAPRLGKVISKHPPKYRNPKDASQTWSGLGRKPGWIKDAQAKGKDLSAFAI